MFELDIINNLGISYKGDYIIQGSQIDRCKKSEQLNIKNSEFYIRNDGKDLNFDNISNFYTGNIYYHLPTLNLNQTNLKELKEIIPVISKNNPKLYTINASSLLYESYEWSTEEEQQNYLKNMSKGIASLIFDNIPIAIENTSLEKDNMLFGKSVSNISDLLVYTRNTLVEQFEYSRDTANKMVGVSLNIGNLIKTDEIKNINEWLKVFYNDIRCIKIKDFENNVLLLSEIIDFLNKEQLDIPIFLENKEELELIANNYKKFEYIVKNKLDGKPMNFVGYQDIVDNEVPEDFKSSQKGYTNLIIICMILLTVIAAVLMLLVHMRQ